MEISQIINVNVYTWYCHRFEHDAGFLSWRQRRVNAVTWNSARLFIWIGCWVGLLAKQVVGDIVVFCLTVTEKKQLARKNDFLFWIQLEKHPLLRPILIYLNLEASLQSLLSFACTFTYSLAQQINCDKILFSHTRRWYHQARKGFIYFMTLWLIFYISDTLGQKEKQMVSTRANDANQYNDWLNFIFNIVIIINCDGTIVFVGTAGKRTISIADRISIEHK